MKRLSIPILFCLLACNVSVGQILKVGIGLQSDVSFDPANQITYLNDSIYVFPTNLGSSATNDKSDMQNHLFISKKILEDDLYFIEAGLRYYRRYSSIVVGKYRSDGFGVSNTLPSISSTFLFPLKGGIHPFKRLQIAAGVSPGLHLRKKGFSLDLNRDRELNEPSLAVQSLHRTLTLNYELSVEYIISKNISLLVAQQGSIGQISRSFKSYGKEYTMPLNWKSLGFSVLYQFNNKPD